MSLILIAADPRDVYIASDGRLSHVAVDGAYQALDEDVEKFRTFNSHTLIAATGNTIVCDTVVDLATRWITALPALGSRAPYRFDELVSVVSAAARAGLLACPAGWSLRRGLVTLVAFDASRGEYRMVCWASGTGMEPEESALERTGWRVVVMGADEQLDKHAHDALGQYMVSRRQHDPEAVAQVMAGIISAYSRDHPSVNANVRWQHLSAATARADSPRVP